MATIPPFGLKRRRFLAGAAGAGLSTGITVAVGTATPAVSAPASPYLRPTPQLIEAEQLVDYLCLPDCPPDNNVYKRPDEPNDVVWGLPGRPETWVVRAQCASFLTAVLRRSFPAWATEDYFRTFFGSASPFARDYYRTFATVGGPHLEPVTRVVDLLPGDLIAIDYRNGQSTNTGHTVMVRRVKGTYTAASPSLNFPGEIQYAVEIVDCTSDPHGVDGVGDYAAFPDTRLSAGTSAQGAGFGHMMFYADEASGLFTRYRWSVNTSSTGTHTVSARPIAAARPS